MLLKRLNQLAQLKIYIKSVFAHIYGYEYDYYTAVIMNRGTATIREKNSHNTYIPILMNCKEKWNYCFVAVMTLNKKYVN